MALLCVRQGFRLGARGYASPSGVSRPGVSRVSRPGERKDAGPSGVSRPGERKDAGPSGVSRPGERKDEGPSGASRPGEQKDAGPSGVSRPGERKDEGPSGASRPGERKDEGPSGVSRPGERKDEGPSGVSRPGAGGYASPSGVSRPGERKDAAPSGVSRPGERKDAAPSGVSRPGERRDEGPVFQYVGKHRKANHKVFVWGFSYTGALGIPSFVVPDSGRKKPRKYQLTPYRLETEQQISSAACGYGFTLLSSNTKDLTKVWGMGLNRDSQLGFQRTQRDRYKSYDYVLEPSPVALPLAQPQDTRVLQVACGRAHSLVLTDSEGVFSLGNNAYGQCGRKIVEDEIYSGSHVIHKMEGFDSPVTQVACGQDHSLFLTETGKVFACGWGADGQTGLGHHHVSPRPVAVGGDLAGVAVAQVTTYGDCSLAVSREGQLYGWGNSEYLQLASVSQDTQVSVPRQLPLGGVGKVTQAACGGTQVAILNEQGMVFVWGYGILGKGPNLSESWTPELVPPTLFGRSDFNPSLAVSSIRCGLNHFAAVTDRGELFVWGKNVRGCLGIGKQDDQYFPWRVTVPGHVVDVACGVDHMVALVKSLI